MRSFPLPMRLARTGCSILALATVSIVGASPAAAQSFLGTGTATNGAATTISNSPGTTTISVTAPQTVINWVPTDNANNTNAPIAFQNAGTSANFLGSGSYAVLNNITATDLSRVISLNGTITAGALETAASANGSIYFYSPSGIVLGGNSMINVGSLVLSASPIFVNVSGNFINGSARQVIFGQALRPTAAITTSAGSQINATGGDVYVAMVAPRVQHGGLINVNGSAALVGAEAAVINFSPDGLFDIQVTTGTTDSQGVSVSGDITGSASTNATVPRRAFLVAVPKNTALTMLIGSGTDLGFNVAGAANVSGNTVILSAGHDIVDGAIGGVSAGSVAGAVANLQVNDGTFTSAVVGDATGFAHFAANSAMYFHSAVDIHANGDILFSTQGTGGTIDVDGTLELSTERSGLAGESVTTSLVNLFTINGGGRITVDGATTLNSNAYGGPSGTTGIAGGDASAGVVRISANDGGTIALLGGLTATANAFAGGAFVSGSDGGDALGGDIRIRTTGDNSSLIIDGATNLTANAHGGRVDYLECFACDSDAGDGRGGDIDIFSDDGIGATLTLNGNVRALADGYGGAALNASSAAGTGYGGEAAFYVGTDARMVLNGALLLQAEGTGGNHGAGNGGAGLGGEAAITETLTATSGTIVINGSAELSSDGQGGNSSGTGGIGGIGTGGVVTGGSYILSDTGSIDINGSVNVHSSGIGGASSSGVGGIGTGGDSSLQSNSRLTVFGNASVTATGIGGAGAAGGDATGGSASVETDRSGATISIAGSAVIAADGQGGASTSLSGGSGGDAVGGSAELHASPGTITIGTVESNGGAMLSADGAGGNASGGTGGDGTGGNIAEIVATDGSDIRIQGLASVSASGFGGDGAVGGDGYGSGDYDEVTQIWTGGAHIFARNADIVINGGARAISAGTGGDASSIAAVGGPGGDGFGGYATIHAANSDSGPSSITIASGAGSGSGTAEVDVGGTGGNGAAGGIGGHGGNGGIGRGGTAGIHAAAGNGTVTINAAVGNALGTGGDGGNGGAGGNGGIGGLGRGGFITVGTVSGTAQSAAVNQGLGDYGSITVNVSGFGGDGGLGSTGGNGGDARGGGVNLLVRGSRVDVDVATLTANATGGDGGWGGGGAGSGGAGGNATVGSNAGPGFISGIDILATGRFLIPTHRGTLNIGSITGTAIARGGLGTVTGTSQNLGGSEFTFLNADGNIGTLDIIVDAAAQAAGAVPESISVINGAVVVDGEFGFVTSGNLSLVADNGSLTADTITLDAANFVPDLATVTPIAPGTFFANSFAIATGNAFLTTANLDSVATLSIVAPGAIQIGNVTGDNSIILDAQGAEVDIGNVAAGGGIDIDAQDFIHTGNIVGNGVIDFDAGASIVTGSILNTGNTSLNAGTSINVGAINSGSGSVSLVTNNSGDITGSVIVGGSIDADSDRDISFGNLTAPGDIELVALGDIVVGNALAGDTIDLDAGGFIDGGNMTAGDSLYAKAGEYVDLLDISAGIVSRSSGSDNDYNVGILAGSTINTGDIEAVNSIGLGAAGNITTGNIDAGNIFLTLGGGNMSFGTIDAGQQAYLADDSMIVLGGDLTGGAFDPATITILTPTPTGGSITLRGAVTTGRFVAAAGTMLTGTTIDSGSSIYTFSGGNTTLTDLNAAGTSIFQRSNAVITENDLAAGTFIDIRSTGGIALGDLVAGDYIDLRSNAAIGLLTANSGETINLQTQGTLTGLTINAGNSVLGQAIGAIQLGNISAGMIDPSGVPGAIYRVGLASNSTIITGTINALGNVSFGTPQNVTTGNLTSGGGIMALIGGNASFGAMNTGPGGHVYLAHHSMSSLGGPFETFNRAPILAQFPAATGGSISISGPVNTGNFRASAGTTFHAGTITSTTNILIDSGGNMTLGNLIAGVNVSNSDDDNAIRLNSSGSIAMGNVNALDSIDFDADGSVTGGNLTSGRSVGGSADGAIILGNLSGGIVNPQGPADNGFSVGASSGTSITVGTIVGAESIGFATLGSITTGSINAGDDFLVMATGNMSFGAVSAGGRVYLADSSMYTDAGGDSDGDDDFDPDLVFAATPVASGGSITLGTVNASSFQAAAGTILTGTTIVSNGLLFATSGGNMSLGNLVAGNDVRLASGSNIATGTIDSDDDVALVATGSISTLDIVAFDDVSADAGTTISTDDIIGNSIELFADGDITTDDLLTRIAVVGAVAHALIPGTSITVDAGDDVATGTIDALDGVHVTADGSIVTGTIDADDFVELFAGGNVTAGTIHAGDNIDIFSDTGLLDLANLHAGTEIDLETGGSLQFGDATAADFNFEIGGSVNGGNIAAINHAGGHANGAILIENITVTGPPNDGDFSIGFTSATSIIVENVDGFDRVGFATPGDLRTGTITAGSLAIALVGGNIVTGSISTDANGRVYLADVSMCGGACGDDDSDLEIGSIIALTPVATGGSITVNGAVTAGRFQASAGVNLTARAITASSIEASAGATAAIDGLWSAPDVTLASSNIDITANGRIDAGTSGSILLNAVSTSGPALIGDGLTGNGYALSNAEFGRLSGGEITIAVGGSGGDADTLIGDLTITGPLAGSNVESSDGGVHFVTLSESGDDLDGTMRVVGDVLATGFGAENYLGFYTQNFELDAATGSIAITGSGNALAGILELYASRIHIASGSLLDQLAVNPQFAGYRDALNSPATVQRPEGVVRAAAFEIEFGGASSSGPYTLLVQNTGTAAVPAGFLLNAASIDNDVGGDLAPGSVDMAINGQIVTASGTSTGVAVRDLLIVEFGTTAFLAGSTINGCPLTGTCGFTIPTINTPTSTDIPLSGSDGFGDGAFGNEGEIAEGEGGGGDGRSSPISPPNPLFDSRPLVQSGDIDDPVSGAGNPSLYGTPDDDVEQCDVVKDKTCKVGKVGDGK